MYVTVQYMYITFWLRGLISYTYRWKVIPFSLFLASSLLVQLKAAHDLGISVVFNFSLHQCTRFSQKKRTVSRLYAYALYQWSLCLGWKFLPPAKWPPQHFRLLQLANMQLRTRLTSMYVDQCSMQHIVGYLYRKRSCEMWSCAVSTILFAISFDLQ